MEQQSEARALLVVHDDAERASLECALVAAGHTVHAERTAAAALAALEAGSFALAIFDAELPDAGPAGLLHELGVRAAERWLPTIAIVDVDAVPRMIALGADEAVSRPVNPEDLRARVHALLRIRARFEELAEQRRALEHLAITDGLTGLYNHRHFQRRLDDEYRRSVRYGQPLALVLLDLDHFKQVNDTHGHPVGDAVLRHAAGVLQNQLRTTDFLARYGGEEFAVVLPQTARAGADFVAHRLGSALEQSPFLLRGVPPLVVTASIGVSHVPAPQIAGTDELISAADQALYRAKRAGRNKVVLAPKARPRSRGSRRVGPH